MHTAIASQFCIVWSLSCWLMGTPSSLSASGGMGRYLCLSYICPRLCSLFSSHVLTNWKWSSGCQRGHRKGRNVTVVLGPDKVLLLHDLGWPRHHLPNASVHDVWTMGISKSRPCFASHILDVNHKDRLRWLWECLCWGTSYGADITGSSLPYANISGHSTVCVWCLPLFCPSFQLRFVNTETQVIENFFTILCNPN